MIQGYPDVLFEKWVDFVDKILNYEGAIDPNSSSTDQLNTIFESSGSNYPTRANEFYKMGLLSKPLTGSDSALVPFLSKEMILSHLGASAYLVYKAKGNLNPTLFLKAHSALSTISLLKVSETYNGITFSLLSLFKFLLDLFPVGDNRYILHLRYLAAAMFCEIQHDPGTLYNSFIEKEKPTLRIIQTGDNEILATFESSNDIANAIETDVPFDGIINARKSNYFIGNHNASELRGFYSKAIHDFDEVLDNFYKYEIDNLNSPEIVSFYDNKTDPIEFLNHLFSQNKLEANYGTMIESLKKACLEATEVLDISSNVRETENTGVQKNIIFFGPPGTGKSYKVDEITKNVPESRKRRVTFHPSYDYTSFVGGYKPISEKNNDTGEEEIKYKFAPQTFTKILVDAWNDTEGKDYYLIIEEINRGNSAEIFGDLFQLLDRDSNYAISPSEDLKEFLSGELNEVAKEILKDGKLYLPSNLYIYATMNTSDQSLYPIDSAFKRRWDWVYVPINYSENNPDGSPNLSYNYKVRLNEEEYFSWISFLKEVNKKIIDNPGLGMDKCVGNYFIKPNKEYIQLDDFVHKVIFYLWNDVFKDEEDTIFDNITYEDFFPVNNVGQVNVKEILLNLDIDIINITETLSDESSN